MSPSATLSAIPSPEAGKRRAVDALGADLGQHRSLRLADEVGAEPPRAADQLRMRQHRLADADRGGFAADAEAGVRHGHPAERQPETDGGAAVHRLLDVPGVQPGPAAHLVQDADLGRMPGALVAGGRPAVVLCQREHPGVLAGAVAPGGRERGPGAEDGLVHRGRQRRVRAAGQVRLLATDGGQHPERQVDVHRLARMGAAGQREGVGAEAEAIGAAVRHERQRLERLGRGAPVRHQVRVARRSDEPALGVHHGDLDGVDRLAEFAARGFDAERGGGHGDQR